MNPILVREFKTLFRVNGPYYFLIFYSIILSFIFIGVVLTVIQGGSVSKGVLEKAGELLVGRLYGIQLILVFVLLPFLTVKMATRDKEQGTFDLLWIVPYGYWRIMSWKFVASIFTWLLTVLLVFPVFLFSFNIGGISIGELELLIGSLMALAFIFGLTGLLWTFVLSKPIYSLVAAYFSIFTITAFFWHYYPLATVYRFLSLSY